MASSSDQPTTQQSNVMLSDVIGRDRSINIFASLTRDVAAVEQRLQEPSQNSTVLAPLNSQMDNLGRKPWEDARDYENFGAATAYEGDDGRDRAQRNLRKFTEAHILPVANWQEGEKVKSLLEGDKEIWWENKEGKKVIHPDGIIVDNVASKVANGQLWTIRGVRDYS
ncbi:FAS1 domain-containing protein [Apiospora kogelbergensis]|uniref:FAS1 domain-containing protein n=1 Tax=Apiospora kogelbergensis TaxID=1337665 RepID=A0AAW0RDQ9_9PEZI